MALAHHVFGEAAVTVGLGSAGALQVLGYSIDGVDIEINDEVEPVFDDRFGPRVPTDEQKFLESARIRAQIIFWDETVRQNVFIRSQNNVTEGVMPGAGLLWGAGGFYYRLLINVPLVSPTNESPWNFLNARMMGSQPIKVGTKVSAWNMTWFAKPFTLATSASGTVLYNRVNT
jgi:hypothetical protein